MKREPIFTQDVPYRCAACGATVFAHARVQVELESILNYGQTKLVLETLNYDLHELTEHICAEPS